MADVLFTDPAKIEEILRTSSRLRYLVTVTYEVPLAAIESVRVDGDNVKVDVTAGGRMLRFKAKGTEQCLVPDAEHGGVRLALDPALAQGLHEIVSDFAPG